MRVSLLSGLVLGMPFVAYQVLSFVLPGLKASERRWMIGGVALTTVLFLAGVAFAWFVMLPTAIPFLTRFMGITTQVRPLNYFSFITSLLFWIGVSFEMPVVVMILGLVGVPPEGIGMILGVDRFLDMCRTTINVTGDLAAATVVARGEPGPAETRA